MATVLEERASGSPALAAATADLAARLRASTVEVRSEERGGGSGVIWRADGLIITNHHVAQIDHPTVVLADGRSFPSHVTARDPERDLAALQIDAGDLPAAEIGDSAAVRVGQLVLAMGHPLGIKGALTMGIVHAVAGALGGSTRWVQADVSLAPGNSGGPLVDAEGRVVGINSMIVGGLALAVPSNAVARFLGVGAEAAWLGVQTQQVPLGPTLAARLGQQSALLVLEVVTQSPAIAAGLLPGDILLLAGAERLADPGDLIAILRETLPGTPLDLALLRGGEQTTLTAILGRREQASR